MMKNLFKLALLLVSVFLTSCSNKDKVSLQETNCKDELPVLGNLIFSFDKNLVSDSMIGTWVKEQYITFSPEIKGSFRWKYPNELVFSPSEPLLPATNYTAKFSKQLVSHSKFKMGNLPDQSWHTPLLSIKDASVSWQANGDNATQIVAKIWVHLNYALPASTIKQQLQLIIDGDKKSFDVVGNGNIEDIELVVRDLKLEDRDYEAKIMFPKGTKPFNGTNGLQADLEYSLKLVSPFNLYITNFEATHDGEQGTIKFYTSQRINEASINKYIALNPVSSGLNIEVQDDGFTLSSKNFDLRKVYDFTAKIGLEGNIGGTLKEQYSTSISFGKLDPEIRFENRKGFYLSSKGSENLSIRINSVEKVRIIVSKIYENNIMEAMKRGYSPSLNNEGNHDYYYEDEYYDDYENQSFSFSNTDGVLGDVIYDKEILTSSLPKYGNSKLLKFDFEDKLGNFKGIYHVQVRSNDDYWVRDSKFIANSNIGLIAKETGSSVVVFCNAIDNAAPLANVDLKLYGRNNQLIGTAKTNATGFAEIKTKSSEFSGFSPNMVSAQLAGDFNYIPFNSTRVNTSRFEVGGKHINSTNMDAFVYGERDVYRPGESAHLSVIVRNSNWTSPGAIPVKLKLLLPNGKEFKALRKSLNQQGSVETEFNLPASAITGTYSFEVYTSNDVFLASKSILIEEFMPDRIKVDAILDKENYNVGDNVILSINAMNFFGPPAANRKWEMEMQIGQKYFRPKGYDEYVFYSSNWTTSFDKIVKEGTTNEDGNAQVNVKLESYLTNNGVLRADFYTTVFDETGRSVSRRTSKDIYTQDILLGLKNDGYYYYDLNKPITFEMVALNKNEKLTSAKARVLIIKKEYKTVLSRYNGDYYRYESQMEEKTVSDKLIDLAGGKGTVSFVPKTPGNYEIRLAANGAGGNYIARSFYSYGSWGNSYNSFEVNNEGNVSIELSKDKFNTGETAKALFKAPFDGKMLVTFETNEVLEHQFVDVVNHTASLQFELKANHLPNIYISATLIKPHKESDMPLTVAHGFKSIVVEDPSRLNKVEIIAANESRSKTKQKVIIKANPGSYVTLAAVDQGILQVTGMKTPNPYSYFYAPRALAVKSYDIYPFLFPEIKGKASSTGGDGFDLSKRTNPLQNKRVKLVSYWSGIKTDTNGEASFEIDIPQFSGELRLMALAYKDNTFGSAEKAMRVADPVVLSSALPRFLSPGDTVIMPVTLSNTTKAQVNISSTIKINGPLTLVGRKTITTAVKGNSESTVVFKMLARNELGSANIKVESNANGIIFTEENDITVRPAASLTKKTSSGYITAGQDKKFTVDAGVFFNNAVQKQLVIGASPVLEIADQLEALLSYPYGCTEQKISTAFPQLYFADLATSMRMVSQNNVSQANSNVQEAIRQIKMRQLYNGAVSLWDNGEEHWWTTCYAAHFLVEARKAGFEVESILLDPMLNYLTQKLQDRKNVDYYYNNGKVKNIAPKAISYSLYILALAGKSQVSAMNYYKQNTNLLATDSRYLLSAAFALAGDKAAFKQLLPISFGSEVPDKQTGGSFNSPIRDEAIALNALLEVDKNNPQTMVMAKHVTQLVKNNRYMNTQERAFAFVALGKFAKQLNGTKVEATVWVDGVEKGKVSQGIMAVKPNELKGKEVVVKTQGTGGTYYFWQIEGIPVTESVTEEDSYLKVRRRYYDRFGRPIEGNKFKQNDLVIVQVSIEKSFSNSIDNVVITDLLPAGFEIENARTTQIPGMDWIKNASTPQHIDVRDDRINLFVSVNSNTAQYYYYAVRAVSKGTYKQGVVSADAMYNGEYHSYWGQRMVEIE